jgi:hypothetical protein
MRPMWKQGANGDWHPDYRGLSIRIKVDPEPGKPKEICWYVGGVLSEISPVNCSLSVAQKIAVKIVDIQISKTRNGHKRNRDCSVGFFSGAEGLSERKLNRLLKCPILTTSA